MFFWVLRATSKQKHCNGNGEDASFHFVLLVWLDGADF
ncbi:hypothetical protein ADICYQ_1378 [Cyclobacterium qasimii M12-11B]|uniref:Uncharacterized protein n=1 Tax=Cyclobacterium qasimii M12-11B TaxID=641524 RepID=S7X0B2_9BACT|nr:hypothetical protein ADICYQ_1378 [Cyclobacterium qasimii M12-11B]